MSLEECQLEEQRHRLKRKEVFQDQPAPFPRETDGLPFQKDPQVHQHQGDPDGQEAHSGLARPGAGADGVTERLKRLCAEGRITEQQYQHFVGRKTFAENARSSRYSANPENIGHRPYGAIDAVLTSPPYANAHLRHQRHGDNGRTWEVMAQKKFGLYASPSSDSTNLGNLTVYQLSDARKSDGSSVIRRRSPSQESYLEAVFTVYQGCFTVLKPGGFMILVTRNFRRQGRMVNLAGDTIRLMEHVGFSFYQHNIAILGAVKLDDERNPYLLPRSSFWQTLLMRKAHQHHEPLHLIQHEDVLVFRKPGEQQQQRR